MCGKHTVQQLGAAGAAVGNSQKLLIFYTPSVCAVSSERILMSVEMQWSMISPYSRLIRKTLSALFLNRPL